MGASAHASVHVGFEIGHDDFWQTWEVTDDHLSCPAGHTRGARRGKHCSECGGKFDHQTRETVEPTGKFAAFCEARKIRPADAVAADPEAWGEGDELAGLAVFCCDGYSDADTPEESHALGVRLAATGDILHMEGGDAVPADKVASAVATVAAVRDELGLGERPVRVYLLASCSY